MLDMADDEREWTQRAPPRRGIMAALRRLFRRDAEPPASRSYRFLARQVAMDLPASGHGALLLLSAATTPASSNDMLLLLAHAMREELGARILLVDGTFRADGIGGPLGLAGAPGLMDWLTGHDRSLAELIRPTALAGVSVLAAGRPGPRAGSAFLPRAVPQLYDDLTGRFDFVLMQQRSILEDTRYLAFASRADLVLLLVEEGVTRVGEVDRALEVFRDHQVGQVRLMLCEPG